MFPADAQRAVETRGFPLAICNGRGPYRWPKIRIPDRRYLLYRHFECVLTEVAKVVCVHTLKQRRVQIAVRPMGHRCRF